MVRNFEESFPRATGFVLKLQPADGSPGLNPFLSNANPFFRLMARSPQAEQICNKVFTTIRDKAARTCEPARSCCFAGFVHIAIPVVSAGEHIATIYGGQLLVKKPTKKGFARIVPELVRLGLGDHLAELEQAWFRTTVVSEKQMKAMVYLVETFALRISSNAATMVLAAVDGEPAAVRRAKRFVQKRFAEPITMPEVARHLQMSASTFSKMFKRELGLTFTQYLTRFRVERSKSMLVHPAVPIRIIAFQTGFASISQFNRGFRQYAEMSPTQYRASLAVGKIAG